MFNVEIYVNLKKTVVDPQGLVVKHALESLGFDEVDDVRCGKMISLKLNLTSKKQAQGHVDTMCKKLLANPIIEDYQVKIKKA